MMTVEACCVTAPAGQMHSSPESTLAVPLRQPLHDAAVGQVALPVQLVWATSPFDLTLAALSHAV